MLICGHFMHVFWYWDVWCIYSKCAGFVVLLEMQLTGQYNSSKCYIGQITLFIHCQVSIGLELGLGLGLMYKYSLVIP